jgi:integrase/recombinase XerC
MGTPARSRRTDIDWLADGPIGPHVSAFKQFLIDHQYAAVTSAKYLPDLSHVNRWVRGRRLSLRRIDEAAVVEFLDEHLPNCRCTGAVPASTCVARVAGCARSLCGTPPW